jgi:tetratricopeptide (TPR) repeat protein
MRNRYVVATLMVALMAVLAGCTRNPEAAKRKYLQSGMKYMDQKKYDSAVIQFKKALQVDPRFAEAHYELGNAEMKLKHWPDAFKEFSVAVDQDPNQMKARIAIAGMLLASGPKNYGKAEESVRYVVEHDPNNTEALVLLGNVLVAEKQQQEGIGMYTKAIVIKPDYASAYQYRGMAYAQLKQDGPAEADLQKAISTDPHDLQAYGSLAGFYLRKGTPKKTEDVLHLAIQNNPDSPIPYLRLAGLYLYEGHKDQGEQVVDQLRKKQPSSPEVAASIGDYYLASRNVEAAVKEYQRGLSANPKNEDLQVRLLEAFIDSGQVEEATKMTDQLLKDNPGDVMARITHARLLALKGNSTEAIPALRDVIKDAPENPQAHFMLGQVLRYTGDLPGAKSELQEAQKRVPDNAMVLQALAETYRDSGDFDTAREYAARFQKLNDNPSAHFLNATIDLGAKDYQGALAELKEAEKSVPNDALLHLNMAFAYAGLKKLADSEHEFQTALKIYPQYDTALADYVAAEFGMKQPEKAVGIASQYAAANPSRSSAHFIYASALATARKWDQAIQEFQKVLQLDPKSYMSDIHIGQIYEFKGQPDAALDAYLKALDLQPKSPLVNNFVGNIYVGKNDLKSAGKHFQEALNASPRDPVAANNLAWVYAAEGENLDMALSLATQAKQIAPDLEGVNDTLAWIQYKKGNYQVAVALAQDAVNKQPERAAYRYHLGMALNGAGDRGRARAELQKALALNLKGPDLVQAQQTLAALR